MSETEPGEVRGGDVDSGVSYGCPPSYLEEKPLAGSYQKPEEDRSMAQTTHMDHNG